MPVSSPVREQAACSSSASLWHAGAASCILQAGTCIFMATTTRMMQQWEGPCRI